MNPSSFINHNSLTWLFATAHNIQYKSDVYMVSSYRALQVRPLSFSQTGITHWTIDRGWNVTLPVVVRGTDTTNSLPRWTEFLQLPPNTQGTMRVTERDLLRTGSRLGSLGHARRSNILEGAT
jgi:hypothetical protein